MMCIVVYMKITSCAVIHGVPSKAYTIKLSPLEQKIDEYPTRCNLCALG